jgi:hypothetical protein
MPACSSLTSVLFECCGSWGDEGPSFTLSVTAGAAGSRGDESRAPMAEAVQEKECRQLHKK